MLFVKFAMFLHHFAYRSTRCELLNSVKTTILLFTTKRKISSMRDIRLDATVTKAKQKSNT